MRIKRLGRKTRKYKKGCQVERWRTATRRSLFLSLCVGSCRTTQRNTYINNVSFPKSAFRRVMARYRSVERAPRGVIEAERTRKKASAAFGQPLVIRQERGARKKTRGGESAIRSCHLSRCRLRGAPRFRPIAGARPFAERAVKRKGA